MSDGPPEIDEADLEELRQDEMRHVGRRLGLPAGGRLAQVRRDVEQRLPTTSSPEFPELGEG